VPCGLNVTSHWFVSVTSPEGLSLLQCTVLAGCTCQQVLYWGTSSMVVLSLQVTGSGSEDSEMLSMLQVLHALWWFCLHCLESYFRDTQFDLVLFHPIWSILSIVLFMMVTVFVVCCCVFFPSWTCIACPGPFLCYLLVLSLMLLLLVVLYLHLYEVSTQIATFRCKCSGIISSHRFAAFSVQIECKDWWVRMFNLWGKNLRSNRKWLAHLMVCVNLVYYGYRSNHTLSVLSGQFRLCSSH
jgi:hypothetical protein